MLSPVSKPFNERRKKKHHGHFELFRQEFEGHTLCG